MPESASVTAARSILEAAGLAIEELDGDTWRVERFTFVPATGFWRSPDGRPGSGTVGLLEAIDRERQISAKLRRPVCRTRG